MMNTSPNKTTLALYQMTTGLYIAITPLFKMKRYTAGKTETAEETKESSIEDKAQQEQSLDMLEEMVVKEQTDITEQQAKQYGMQLQKIEDEIGKLYDASKENPDEFGYAEMKRVYELESQMQEVRDKYHSMSDETAHSIETSEQIVNKLKMYKS